MAHVLVELWMWLGEELGRDFSSPSEMRSTIRLEMNEEAMVKDVLDRLARRYPSIDKNVFNKKQQTINPSVMLLVNDRVFPRGRVLERVIQDGDKIIVLPVYEGG